MSEQSPSNQPNPVETQLRAFQEQASGLNVPTIDELAQTSQALSDLVVSPEGTYADKQGNAIDPTLVTEAQEKADPLSWILSPAEKSVAERTLRAKNIDHLGSADADSVRRRYQAARMHPKEALKEFQDHKRKLISLSDRLQAVVPDDGFAQNTRRVRPVAKRPGDSLSDIMTFEDGNAVIPDGSKMPSDQLEQIRANKVLIRDGMAARKVENQAAEQSIGEQADALLARLNSTDTSKSEVIEPAQTNSQDQAGTTTLAQKNVTHKRDGISDLVHLDSTGRAHYESGINVKNDADGNNLKDGKSLKGKFMAKHELDMIEEHADLIRDGLANRNDVKMQDTPVDPSEPMKHTQADSDELDKRLAFGDEQSSEEGVIDIDPNDEPIDLEDGEQVEQHVTGRFARAPSCLEWLIR